MDRTLAYMFRKFDPITRMIIDRDSGNINNYFTITKGQRIDLYAYATLGRTENDTPDADESA